MTVKLVLPVCSPKSDLAAFHPQVRFPGSHMWDAIDGHSIGACKSCFGSEQELVHISQAVFVLLRNSFVIDL